VLIGRVRGPLPQTIATFIPSAAAFAVDLMLEALPVAATTPGWHSRAWRATSGKASATLLAAIENTGVAAGDKTSPGVPWGTADVQTDGRVAVLLEYPGRTQSFVVNGRGIAPVRELAASQPTRR
jgi:hypothetical protein